MFFRTFAIDIFRVTNQILINIMRIFSYLLPGVLLLCSCSKAEMPSVVPLPQEIAMGSGSFALAQDAKVGFEGVSETDAERLLKAVKEFSPEAVATADGSQADILLSITGEGDPEGYSLDVSKSGIKVSAPSAAGLFYGLQTIEQTIADGEVPSMVVTDSPRFPYRGFMIDISRHFRDADFIKKQIDAMADLKLNRLHLHLTDAAGWRIQIDSHPELTEIAAWRPQETWQEWADSGAHYCSANDPRAHGGFLSKADVRDLVEYAADRYITIIPEIEIPSHSAEVTAVYPGVRCDSPRPSYPDLCVGSEESFELMQDVLAEVIEMFPSEYIHIGGDEASKIAWQTCKKCQKRMKEEGLENVDELQSYMTERIEKWVNERGRNIIGWDEILEGGLAPNATVMSWRGTEGGIKAARMGHDAIMVPGAYCYLDSYQDAPLTQPEAFGPYMPIKKVYSYNPAPDTLDAEVASRIIGVQGNIWAEKIPTAEYMEYLVYPRLVAIAEVGWTDQDKRDWENFRPRAVKFTDGLRAKGYNAFDLSNEIGDKPESLEPVDHLARGKKVTYNVPFWNTYPANGDSTLTDGVRGGWTYGDKRWQGFLYKGNQRIDVTIDLESVQPIEYIGAEFMQMCTPDVWMPQEVVISVSADGENFTELAKIPHQQEYSKEMSFKTFAWEAPSPEQKVDARYVRYQAFADKGVQFIDEIIVK